MLCKNCKREIEYKESFEKMTDRVLRSAIEKLKKESGFGIPDNKEKQWQKRK